MNLLKLKNLNSLLRCHLAKYESIKCISTSGLVSAKYENKNMLKLKERGLLVASFPDQQYYHYYCIIC